MGIAPHIARLRAVVGHELLLLPSVSLLIRDTDGRILLAKEAGRDDGWGVPGGAVDIGESPAEAAVREAREEIGTDVRLVRLLDVLGGPDYEVSYPNGDLAAYVARRLRGSHRRRFAGAKRRRAERSRMVRTRRATGTAD